MNRSLTNVLFGGAAPVAAPSDYKIEGQITQTSADDVVEALANADSVILASSSTSPSPFSSHVSVFRRLSVTVWPWQRHNTRYQKSHPSCGQRA